MPEHMRRFQGFMIQTLLDKPWYAHLSVFAELLQKSQGLYPKSFPKLGQAIVGFSAAPVRGTSKVVVEGLKGKKDHLFYTSVLYTDYIHAKNVANFEAVKLAHDMDTSLRYQSIAALLEDAGPQGLAATALGDSRCEDMLVMKTLLGPTPTSAKVTYVLHNPLRVQVLSDWAPGHELISLAPFASPSAR